MKRNYSQEDIAAMQQDAIRRVKEMDRRAKAHLHPSAEKVETGCLGEITLPIAETKPSHGSQKKEHSPTKADVSPLPFGQLLEGLGFDSDHILIIVLIIILMQEGADKLLIFALVYLML